MGGLYFLPSPPYVCGRFGISPHSPVSIWEACHPPSPLLMWEVSPFYPLSYPFSGGKPPTPTPKTFSGSFLAPGPFLVSMPLYCLLSFCWSYAPLLPPPSPLLSALTVPSKLVMSCSAFCNFNLYSWICLLASPTKDNLSVLPQQHWYTRILCTNIFLVAACT